MRLPAQRPRTAAHLTEALESPGDKRQFRRGAYDPAAGTVAPVGGPGSHLLGSLARSNCLIDISETTSHLEAGEQVVVWRTGAD
jgi:molybdopterin molybdotransferase